MDFAFSPHLRELKQRAGELAAKFMAHEEHCEFTGGLPAGDLVAARKEILTAGLQAINMPKEWGGAGLSVLEQVVVQEELGQLTNGLWKLVWQPSNALRAATPAQRERWLKPCIRGERRDAVAITEPGAGSDPQSLVTRAERVGDRFRLTGEKWFVTLGDQADFVIVLAVVPDGGPTLFLVDKDLDGVRIKRMPRYTHAFVFEHPEFLFQDVDLGPETVLGGVGQGLALTRTWFTEERLMIGARAVGAARRALTLAPTGPGNGCSTARPSSGSS